MDAIVEVKNICKSFLSSRALTDVNLQIVKGECLGIVGHNGAGKSTLVNILTGTYPQTSGTLLIDGEEQGGAYDVYKGNQLGIRSIFQELSLCANLTVLENMKVFHPSLKGPGWKKTAEEKIRATLDSIFPGHGIDSEKMVKDLTLGQRQMVEIAKAFTVVDEPLRLVILDEPTSALDHRTSGQLIDYLNSLKGSEISCIYISHLFEEIMDCTDRILVMKDGLNMGIVETESASKDRVISMMGNAEVKQKDGDSFNRGNVDVGEDVIAPLKSEGEARIRVRQGEIIGLAGLAGHGQTRLLLDLFEYKKNREYEIKGPVTFIPGDRQTDGVFPKWSIVQNLTLQVYEKMKGLFLINTKKEEASAEKWQKIIDIKSASLTSNILSLSGGNQQKVLFARCLESSSPVVLMDDPTRGVDVGTKSEIYKLILAESEKGRSFVWYTTEMEELQYCDRIYVFNSGKIREEFSASDATEEKILKSSFT